MPDDRRSSATMDATEIESWLRQKVAEYSEREPTSFDRDTPLADLGLDSVYALVLCGDLEDAYGIEVEPSIVWDHPTIGELAEAIGSEVSRDA